MMKKVRMPNNLTNNGLLFETDVDAKRVLEAEGRKLKYCALKVWRQYLSSYKPEQYVRTKKSINSIKLGNVYQHGEGDWRIEVTFDNDLAYHDSVLGSQYQQGHAIILISFGWKVQRGAHKDIPRFGYYEGYDYLQKVSDMYKGMRDKRVGLEITWSGKALR